MSRRISRRAFIGGAAGATALAAGGSTWAILATRDETAPASRTRPAPTPQAVASTPSPTATLPPPPPGGRQVIVSPMGLDLDTFDAQLSGKSAVVEVLGRTHSRLVQWTDIEGAWEVRGDLASGWEAPDPATVIFHLNPKAKWHDKPPLNGRALTADDVVAHFRRAIELAAAGKAPLAQRYHAYSSVDSIDSPAPGQVRFRMKEPDQFMFDTLASEFALIQAPEAVRDFAGDWRKLDSDHVIGTGPWAFDWADDGVKFTAARGGHREAQLDELFLTEAHDNAQRFIDGALDESIAFDRREAAEIVANTKATFDEYRRPAREIVMSTFFIGVPPWNNLELVTAISSALARSELVETLFGGRASSVRGVPLSVVGTRVSDTLEGLPGDIPGPDASYSGARRRWEAAGGPGLGTVTVDFPSVFDPLYSASSVVVDQLNRVLGAQFRPAVETYTTISKRVLDGHYGNGRAAFWFGWGPPLSSASAAAYYNELYAPGSPGQLSVGGPGSGGGASGARKLTTQGYLGIVPWVQQYNEVYRLRSKAGPFPSPFWQQHMDYTRRNA